MPATRPVHRAGGTLPRREPHPLLVDWLAIEPVDQFSADVPRGALRRADRVLVVGSRADADALSATGAPDSVVVHAHRVTDTPTQCAPFDLVVVVHAMTGESGALATTLAALAAAVAPGGTLLIIAAGGEHGLQATDLAPLPAHGLQVLSFDDLTEGPARGHGDRWLRVLFARTAC